MTALPFQAGVPNLALTAIGGFQPQLLLGISFFEGKGTAGAGIFLDSPLLTSTLSTVHHVSSKCENATANNDIFDTLTHVDASVDVGVGLTAEADVDIGGISFGDAAPYSVLQTAYALPTACLKFDAGAKSYVPATATPSVTTTTTTAKSHDGAKSGAAGVVRPFGAQGAGFTVMLVVSELVVVGSLFFMLL